MKETITIDNFKCTCGSDRFIIDSKDVDYSSGKVQYKIAECVKCFAKYRNDGAGPDGKFQIFRQGALSDEWLPDNRLERVLN